MPSSGKDATATKPARAHESLWKRSAKIFGVSRRSVLLGSPDKESSDGDSNSKDDTKPPVSKRREQVRRAQKVHRQRTESYITALEQEVLRLQKVEAETAAAKESLQNSDVYIKTLEQEVVQLRKVEMTSSVPFDGNFGTDVYDTEFTGMATVSLLDQNGKWTLTAQMNQPDHFFTQQSSDLIIGSQEFSSQAPTVPFDANQWANLLSVNPLVNCQRAVDFILRLEEPCMAHLHAHAQTPLAVSGHTMTASASFVDLMPPPLSPPTSCSASDIGIQNLMLLSSKLPLEGEITPVEAWKRILQHRNAHRITANDLVALEQELKTQVECYGFGGVIEELWFTSVLEGKLGGLSIC